MKKRNFRYVLSLELKDVDSFDKWEEIDSFFGKQDPAMSWIRKILKKYKDNTPNHSEIRIKFCGFIYE